MSKRATDSSRVESISSPDPLLERLESFGARSALAGASSASFADLLARVAWWRADLVRRRLSRTTPVVVCGDFSPEACALLLALRAEGNIAVPLPAGSPDPDLLRRVNAGLVFSATTGEMTAISHPDRETHPLYRELEHRRSSGLVLFTSGSTGRSKAALLDFTRLWSRLPDPKRGRRTLAFLLFDHIGGMNTMFQTLAGGGCLVTAPARAPDVVGAAIERYGVEVLPTTPTFLRMLLVSRAHERYDLSSLRLVTYGAEPMPAVTLRHLCNVFPSQRFKQTYGMSELGILPSRSRDSGSVWIQTGGDGFDVKVVDGRLFLRADTAMLGYLEGSSPFDRDGWLDTGDAVEVDGSWIRILGRVTDSINVGGQKVHPADVESVLLDMDNVVDVLVRAVPNVVTGQIVGATLVLRDPEEPAALRSRIRHFCTGRLARHQIPAVVDIAPALPAGHRLKRERAVLQP